MAAGQFDDALVQADLAIDGYFALPEDDYPDWAKMNKALSLFYLGHSDDASDILEDYLAYRERTFGVMDSESFK